MNKLNNHHSSIEETASIFGIKLNFLNEIKVQENSITIPISYKNLDDSIGIGFCLLLKGISLNNEENQNNGLLSEFEQKEISLISKYIQAHFSIQQKYLLTNTSKHTIKFLNKLKVKLGNSSSFLLRFLSEKLENIEIYENSALKDIFDDITKDYLNSKMYDHDIDTQKSEQNRSDIDGRSEVNELVQQDIEVGEQAEGQDNGVFSYINPKIKGKFLFRTGIYEDFNHRTLRFQKYSNDKKEIYPSSEDTLYTLYYTANNPNKTYTIPLPKGYKITNFDTSKVQIFVDKYGCYTLKVKTPGENKLGIGIDFETYNEEIEKSSEEIYTGNKIPHIGDNPFEIIAWIKETKKYKETNQKKLVDISENTNSYIENIYNAEEIECMTANMFFVAMCRRIGYPARVIAGISAYHKSDKTFLSNNRGHAWSEVYIDGKWLELDATPILNDDKKNKDENSNGESIEEICSSMGDDENQSNNPNKNDGEKTNGVNYGKAKQIKENKQAVADILSLSSQLDEITKSAIDYVYNDYLDIVEYIRHIMALRQENDLKRRMSQKSKKIRYGLSDGELKITSEIIRKLSVGDPNIFTKKIKPKLNQAEDTETKLDKISIAIDISSSMGGVNGNWELPKKMESAYLMIVLLGLISKELKIDLNVVLFSSSSFTIKEPLVSGNNLNPKFFQEILEIMRRFSALNNANSSGIQDMLSKLKGVGKGLGIILSDGDGNSNAFFTDSGKSKQIVENNNICVIGYGLGDDASKMVKTINGKIFSVIESQLDIGDFNKSKGYPLKNYKLLLPIFKEHLSSIMTQKQVKLK